MVYAVLIIMLLSDVQIVVQSDVYSGTCDNAERIALEYLGTGFVERVEVYCIDLDERDL